jgi:hypothetical protein
MGPDYYTEMNGLSWNEDESSYDYDDSNYSQPGLSLYWDSSLNDEISSDTISVTIEIYDEVDINYDEGICLSASTITGSTDGLTSEYAYILNGTTAGVYTVEVPVKGGSFGILDIDAYYMALRITSIDISGATGFWTNFSEQYESASA